MAITVNYYPRMDDIAQTAYGGGQTQEGIRQQNFGLNVEQLAQRERMQDQDLGFRQGAQLFDAQVGMAQQARGIAANQQSQMYAQAGRERLAMFDAAQRQQAMSQQLRSQFALNQQEAAQRAAQQQQAFQQQQALQQQDYALKQGYTKDMLTLEGQQKMAEFERQRMAVQKWAESTPGVPPEQIAQIMSEIDAREAGFDYNPFAIQQPQTFEQKIAERVKLTEDGSGFWIEQPDGKIDFRPVSKAKEGQAFINQITGEEIPPFSFFEHNGGLYFADSEKVSKLADPPKQESFTFSPADIHKMRSDITQKIIASSSSGLDSTPMSWDAAWEKAGNYLPQMDAGQGSSAPQQNNYGGAIPPAAPIPPQLQPYAKDGYIMDSGDFTLRGADAATVQSLAPLFPTVTTKEQYDAVPVGAYFNAYIDGMPFKPGVLKQ